jgi:SAM-dependent methyltransferase
VSFVFLISLHQAHEDSLPPNCSFIIDDAEDEWTFGQKFGFIHGRCLVSCFKDPKAVFQQAYDALVPGGYLELRDPIFPFQFLDPPPEGSPLVEWNSLLMEAAAKVGRPWDNAGNYKTWLEEIGFEDVFERREFATLSPWAKGKRSKYLSLWLQHDILSGLEALSMALFTRVLGWSPEKLKDFLEGVKKDIKDTKIHAYSEG